MWSGKGDYLIHYVGHSILIKIKASSNNLSVWIPWTPSILAELRISLSNINKLFLQESTEPVEENSTPVLKLR